MTKSSFMPSICWSSTATICGRFLCRCARPTSRDCLPEGPTHLYRTVRTGEIGPDLSEDIAREIMRRLGLAGDQLPSSLEAFVDSHFGPNRQLTLRLA
jgi:hypothetical protein